MEQKEIKTKEEARQYAIDWQNWVGEQNLYMSELVEWNEYFYRLAKKFHLVREFKENGII